MKEIVCLVIVLIGGVLGSCKKDSPTPEVGSLRLKEILLNGASTTLSASAVPVSSELRFNFSQPIDRTSAGEAIVFAGPEGSVAIDISFDNGDSAVIVKPHANLSYWKTYGCTLKPALQSVGHKQYGSSTTLKMVTTYDPSDKFTVVTDSVLLDLVQQKTFKYFYDYAEPNSGMARERLGSDNTVTSGGSGFGIMALIVAMERKFITRQQGLDHMDKILTFLEKADRFHGAWSHWINGSTGHVIPFSTKDDGGDLVETSFLLQGLITFRQYLDPGVVNEKALIDRIQTLWEGVEWDWYRKNNEQVLYWHWSPNYNWDMNFPLYGYFEEQITYILAAASPTHTIPKEVYSNGYGKNGAIKTGNTYYGYQLPLGDLAPLFWVQYSYLGMDPHFSDDYANYWTQNVNATLIDYSYCVANPHHYAGYSDKCWGLTASDNEWGYDAHSPNNDRGVITPTAALACFPYAPEESMRALKFFYYTMGDHLWGDYGFYDAINLSTGWTASSYLAIDQGPIVVMIENYRTGLLWKLFMSAPEIQTAKDKLGFTN